MGLNKNSKIFLAGHNGLVGSSILKYFKEKQYKKIFTIGRSKLDLTNQFKTEKYLKYIKPDFVIIAAAKVGGIYANQNFKAEFIYKNLMIQTNLIHASYKAGVKKLIFLGSSCIYPKYCKQPIKEEYLLSGKLEKTNDAYAIAKIAGLKMCEAYNQQYKLNYICLMPTNLYGPNDNYDLDSSHVLPAMIRKFHEAKDKVTLWGDGSAMREFLYVDDLAEAAFKCMVDYDSEEIINVGTGKDITIKELATTIADVVGFKGDIVWDTSKPNGTPRKVLNIDKIKSLGWEPKVSLKDGIERTYQLYKESL